MANTTIRIKHSGTPSNEPTNLEYGELAINYADGKIFYKNVNNQIATFSSGGGGGEGGGDSFGIIVANGVSIVASDEEDALTIEAGNNIIIVGDAVNDKITISADLSPAYNQANTAYDRANAAGSLAATVFGVANQAFGRANAASVNVGNTTPTGPEKLWWNSDLGKFFVKYIDEDLDEVWVEAAGGGSGGGDNTANLAFDRANTANTLAATVFGVSNSAFAAANSASSEAAVAFGRANIANTLAETVFGVANQAFGAANTADTKASAAFGTANTAGTNASNAFGRANTANGLASQAFDRANIANTLSATVFGVANQAFGKANSAGDVTASSSFGTDNVLIASDGTGKGVKATSIDANDVVLRSAVRERLTANRTYYVRSDGSDSNDGLSNTSGGAFLTVQKAIDVAVDLDIGIYDVTISVGAGTFSTATGNVLKNIVGSGSILIQGAGATTIIDTTGTMTTLTANFAARAVLGRWRLDAMKLTCSGSGTKIAVLSGANSYVEVGNIDYGAGFSQHVRAADGGVVLFKSDYTISGSCDAHLTATNNGIIRCASLTVTITGTPAWAAAFAQSSGSGGIVINGMTYSGSATGARYSANLNGVINTLGGGASYFPGNSAGSTATGGQYA